MSVYNDTLSSLLDKHAPIKSKAFVERDLKPWISDKILEMKRTRMKLEKLWRRTRLTVHQIQFSEQCFKVKEEICNAKEQYFKQKIDECEGNQGQLYAIVNSLLGREKVIALPEAESPKHLADTFSDYFVTKIAKIRSDLCLMEASCPAITDLLPKPVNVLTKFRPTSEEEITKIINKSNKTSCTLDPIPTKLLADILPAVTASITHIANLSLSSGIFPHELKSAVVKPLLKKQGLDKEVLKNYRPVSNLSFLSKCIERVIASLNI